MDRQGNECSAKSGNLTSVRGFQHILFLSFTQEQAWSRLPANNYIFHSHYGDRNPPPTSSLKGNLQRQLFLLIPIVTDVLYHLPPHASSSVKDCPLSAASWGNSSIVICGHSHSIPLTSLKTTCKSRKTNSPDNFLENIFRIGDNSSLQAKAVGNKREASSFGALKCHQVSQL